jgi:anti-anti-sigma regulatory factor
MVASQSTILPTADHLSHAEACRLASLALKKSATRTVVIDLSRCRQASTAAFARLVLLRRAMLDKGRDLRLAGLSGRPAQLFEVHRLASVLPTLPEPSLSRTAAPRDPIATVI